MFTVLYLVFVHSRKQSEALIQLEVDAGKTMQFKNSMGGVVGGIRYRGPMLVLAIFDDCFILKDKKVLFSDIKAIRLSRFKGVIIETHTGEVLEVFDRGSFLTYFPEALRPDKNA